MRSAQITGILAPLIAVSVVMQQILSVMGAEEAIGGFVRSMGGYYPVLFTAMAMSQASGLQSIWVLPPQGSCRLSSRRWLENASL